MTTTPKQTQVSDTTKADTSGPAGALAALKRAANAARKVAKMTQTEVITVADSSVAKQMNLLTKR